MSNDIVSRLRNRVVMLGLFDDAAKAIEVLRGQVECLRQQRDQARRMYVNCSLRRRLPSQPVMSSRERAAELGWHDAFSALDATRDEPPDLIDLDRGIPSDGDRCQREAL